MSLFERGNTPRGAEPRPGLSFGQIGTRLKAALAILALLICTAVIALALRTRSPQKPSRIDLTLVPVGENMLRLSWNRSLPGISDSRSAALHISDGGNEREVLLDRAQLANGFLIYKAGSNDVTFKMQVQRGGQDAVYGSLRFIGSSLPLSARAGRVAKTSANRGIGSAAVASGRDQDATDAEAQSPTGVADRTAVRNGIARFVVRTPGVRITIRRADIPDSPETEVTSPSLALTGGTWTYQASAPGFEPESGRFLVNAAGPADIFVRLRPKTSDQH